MGRWRTGVVRTRATVPLGHPPWLIPRERTTTPALFRPYPVPCVGGRHAVERPALDVMGCTDRLGSARGDVGRRCHAGASGIRVAAAVCIRCARPLDGVRLLGPGVRSIASRAACRAWGDLRVGGRGPGRSGTHCASHVPERCCPALLAAVCRSPDVGCLPWTDAGASSRSEPEVGRIARAVRCPGGRSVRTGEAPTPIATEGIRGTVQ